MIRKRNPLDESMTFGQGIPIDILGIDPPDDPNMRVLPSQFFVSAQQMQCAFIKNTFENKSDNTENLY